MVHRETKAYKRGKKKKTKATKYGKGAKKEGMGGANPRYRVQKRGGLTFIPGGEREYVAQKKHKGIKIHPKTYTNKEEGEKGTRRLTRAFQAQEVQRKKSENTKSQAPGLYPEVSSTVLK